MMDSFEVLKVLSRHRGDAIVVTAHTSSREWAQVSTHPELDLSMSGCMGKASSVGLGLALARPSKKVMVFDGDGALLMNLGTLATIANIAPPNLIHFLFENGVYRTTGGQPTPAAGKLSFPALARDAGYANVHHCNELSDLGGQIEAIMNEKGPTFVSLSLPALKVRPPFPTIRGSETVARFKEAMSAMRG